MTRKMVMRGEDKEMAKTELVKTRFKRDKQKMGANRSQVKLVESSALETVFDSSEHGSTKRPSRPSSDIVSKRLKLTGIVLALDHCNISSGVQFTF